jgi:hypothetical protein
MALFKNGDENYKWLERSRYSNVLVLAIDYVVGTFEHRKSKATNDPLPRTAGFLEAMKSYDEKFPPG